MRRCIIHYIEMMKGESDMKPSQLNQYQANKKYKKDMFCPNCNQIYRNTSMTACGLCGKKLIPYSENLPKCPTCQSTNVRKISVTKRAAHGVAFGILSNTARSQFECLNCGMKF